MTAVVLPTNLMLRAAVVGSFVRASASPVYWLMVASPVSTGFPSIQEVPTSSIFCFGGLYWFSLWCWFPSNFTMQLKVHWGVLTLFFYHLFRKCFPALLNHEYATQKRWEHFRYCLELNNSYWSFLQLLECDSVLLAQSLFLIMSWFLECKDVARWRKHVP